MDDDPQQERHVWCVLDSVVKISSTKRKKKKIKVTNVSNKADS